MQTENDFIKRLFASDPKFTVNKECYRIDKDKNIILEKYNENYYSYNEVKQIDTLDNVACIKKYVDDYDEIIKTYKLKITGRELNYTITNLCRAILQRAFKNKEFEELDDFENEKLNKIKAGQYITYTNTELKTTTNTTTYDVNSFYAYVLKSSSSFSWCHGKGKQRKITRSPGVCGDHITEVSNLYENQYFQINILDHSTLPFYMKTTAKTLWVTNWDILIFNRENTKYELNSDYLCNNYYYEKEITARNSFFEKLLDSIYVLKSHNTLVKNVLSKIIGVMMSKTAIHTNNYNSDKKLIRIDRDEDGQPQYIYEKHKVVKGYEHNISRNKLFIFGYIKYKFMKIIRPVLDNKIPIYRIYCDSITCEKNEFMDALIEDKIGKMKIENKPCNNKVGYFQNNVNFILI